MIRTSKPDAGFATSWIGSMRRRLRPIDRVGLYGPRAVLIALPEVDADAAVERAFVLLAGARVEEPSLVCGISLFPEIAGSAEQLVEIARAECQRARPGAVPILPSSQASGTFPALDPAGPVVKSPAMKRVFETVKRAAGSRIPVLVLGETGTGKEVVARALHEGGPRSKGPLRFVNCGAIPATLVESVLFGHERGAFTGAVREQKGAFEEASGGTLLLDEIGELPMAAQTTLLRVLETRRLTRIGSTREIEVDVRVLTATNRDLEGMVAAGTFRQDLLYRLNTLVIALPPLRQRREEILPLAERFLEEANRSNASRVRGIDASALELLCEYEWPGNVRELRNVIERAVVLAQGDVITTADLSDRIVAPLEEGPDDDSTASTAADFKSRVRRYETQLITDALKETSGNQTEAARRLGIPLRTLVHKLGTLGIRKRGHDLGS
jgi:DNA-binding NtrC family response regulator